MSRPEDRARERIDQRLTQAGWLLQDMARLNPGAARGVAVREYPTDSGQADYVLLDRQPVGVIEAKRDGEGERLTPHEVQTDRYAHATLKWCESGRPLRFLFEATGQLIRFTDALDPAPRSRKLHFFRPEQLADWIAQPGTLRGRLPNAMPQLPEERLRECQVAAVHGLEAYRPGDVSFLAWQLIVNGLEVLDKCTKDETTVASIEAEHLGNVPVLLAPTAEQARIVSAIAVLQSANHKLALYRQFLLKSAVDGSLTADWRSI